jgi:hypothetical protein
MLTVSVLVFALAAVFGLVLAVRRFRDQPLPTPLALVHGLAAATGLVLLLLVVLGGTAPAFARIGLAVLAVAALGGFFLFSFHLRKAPLPKGVVVIHALAAVAGFGLVLAAVLGS